MTAIDTVRTYSRDVLSRARVPMPPFAYDVHWDEQPRRHKFYPDSQYFALPIAPAQEVRFDEALAGVHAWSAEQPLNVARLGRALHDTYGHLARRVRVSGNDDALNKTRSTIATYARGTANGGGLYPLEFYWVSGPSTPQVPGIYHWNTNSGALQRLLAGDVTPDVRAALSGTADTDQFLLVTVKYWKNAFKYNSFTHHVVTSDLGSATEVLRWSGLVAPSEGRPVHMWFDSEILDGMLGLDPVEETVLAVIPLPQGELERNDRCDPGGARVHISESERFTARAHFTQVVDVIAAERSVRDHKLLEPLSVTVPTAHSIGAPIPLPHTILDSSLGLSEALYRRRSAFGTFDGCRSMSLHELSYLLASMVQSARPGTEAGVQQLGWPAVLINRVDGIAPGAYLVDVDTWSLIPVDNRRPGEFLQQTYFLDNYNVDHAEVVLTLLVPVDAIIDAVGARGVRLANLVLGAVTQATYVAAADLDLACGAALGFDSVAYAERLGIEDSGLRPMIMIMVGHDRTDQADLRLPISVTTERGV